MKAPITLRGIATADAVRRFETQRVPMVVQPYPTGDVPAGWLPVLMAAWCIRSTGILGARGDDH